MEKKNKVAKIDSFIKIQYRQEICAEVKYN